MSDKLKIVIVDDTQINIIMLEKLLQTGNYDVVSFSSAEGVVEYLKENIVHLILLDIMMPVVDGFELCTNIKGIKEISDIPVVFISAKNEEADKVKGFELGAIDYIEKPFKAQELLSRVGTHIQAQLTRLKLKEANVEKDKFLSILSHDLRGPFTSILGNLELLSYEDVTEDNSENVLQIIEDIRNSSKNFYKLLEDLLQWGLVRRGKIVVNIEKTKVVDLFQAIEMLYSHSFKAKGIELSVLCSEELYLNADSFMMKEAIANIISNAIKFTNRDGKITLRGIQADNKVILSVEDNGVGMTQEQMGKLFSLASSTSTSGTEKEKGTGLGMILVDEFIRKNSGIIEVESNVGKGTTFRLIFDAIDS